jgi:hypothetical protein
MVANAELLVYVLRPDLGYLLELTSRVAADGCEYAISQAWNNLTALYGVLISIKAFAAEMLDTSPNIGFSQAMAWIVLSF